MSKSTKSVLLGACAAAVLLSGCKTVGPDFAAPPPPQPAAWVMKGDAVPANVSMNPAVRLAGPWWSVLGSRELNAVMQQALENNPTVEEASAAIDRALADYAAVRAGQGLQTAAIQAGVERERINTQAFGFTGFPSPTINLFTIGGGVSYDLDLFGGQKRAAEDASARIDAQQRRADAAYLTLTGNVAVQAIRIAALQSQIDTVEGIVAADRRQIEMIRKAEQAGGAASSQTTVGQAQLDQDLALLPPLKRDLAAARHQLALLVGKTPADWTAPDFTLASFRTPAHIPVSLPSALARNRPDILAAEADLHAATARIGVAEAALYPDVKLNVGLTQSAIHSEDIFSSNSSGWNIGPSVRIPIFDRAGKARRDAAVAEAKASLARYQGTVLRAFVQVADAMTALAHDQAEVDALLKAEATGRAAVNDNQKAYDLGGGPLISVVDAQRRLTQVQRQIVQARGRALEDLVQLHAATGANWKG